MRSFLRVCKRAGFSKETGLLYWKMFFTVIIRNPKGIEAAVNLAAMFIHFRKQKKYIVSVTSKMIADIEATGETAFNARLMGWENRRSPCDLLSKQDDVSLIRVNEDQDFNT